MLNSLSIKNIALIESLEISFDNGLNILSGETGAGKSIIIDSLNFVLGQRADKTLIRYGQESATVCAYFDKDFSDKTLKVLSDFDIEFEGEILLKRVMTIDGKNSCLINGQKVTLGMLKELTSTLVDIYGQHESAKMLNNDNHIQIIDMYGQEEIMPLIDNQSLLLHEYKQTLAKLNEYGNIAELNKNIDLYEYQINEIEQADLQEDEEEQLIAQRHMLNNSQNILESLEGVRQILNGDSSQTVLDGLNLCKSLINKVIDDIPQAEEYLERLESAKIELKDICESLSDIADECEFDPREYQECEDRLTLIRSLKRKYGASVSDILSYLEEIKEKYEFLQDGEEAIEKLEIQKERQADLLYKNSVALSRSRRHAAEEMKDKITQQLRQLGMKGSQFVVQFEEIPAQEKAIKIINQNGFDNPIFLFSANEGQPPKELSKIISGGELSRFMLAIKNIIADLDGINCMVFDEIDTGISGNIAQTVAQKLYRISCNRQVLAVTHLPQLASMADVNYLISKSSVNGNTTTTLIKLENQSLYQEIARLIGGNEESQLALSHAKEMKEFSNNTKTQLRNGIEQE